MKLVIDITEHNKSVIDRFVNGEGFEVLPTPIIDDVVRAIRNGKPIVHGKWLEWLDDETSIVPIDENGNSTRSCWCSNCTVWLAGSDEYPVSANYCPNCGADMRGGK
jgi:hypothetical protein